jgi:hypothetical protein
MARPAHPAAHRLTRIIEPRRRRRRHPDARVRQCAGARVRQCASAAASGGSSLGNPI